MKGFDYMNSLLSQKTTHKKGVQTFKINLMVFQPMPSFHHCHSSTIYSWVSFPHSNTTSPNNNYNKPVAAEQNMTRNTIFAVTWKARVKEKHWEQKIGGRGGWYNRCTSEKSNNTSLKPGLTDLHKTKHCHKTRQLEGWFVWPDTFMSWAVIF